ncbi:hypothetical protein OZX69_03510 [Lactobacillus sp. ESL0731]|uniref:hypothetical protein n=1 Tax=unclassified Lactobacillus TaxID=2620435 RepID=UPI0023F6BCE7|nr:MULTISPECIES: hypothetical protein [unclassified Lactobacillus]WEV51777.1 hypothetical protein OZX63_03510 [Lactobacillus sp. ESL0700]WEV62906.1 hypothetical protein OZX69_03510 [Lactobacillus sp. ESL0731]
MEKGKTTIREQLLTERAYKIGWLIALGELVIILVLAIFKKLDLGADVLVLLSLSLMDLFTTFFQKRHITFIISLLLGVLLAIVICIILFVGIIWLSGNMIFTK